MIKLYNKGEAVCSRSTNADLYKLLFHHIKSRQIKLSTYWIPSYLDNPKAKTKKGLPKQRPDWVQDYDIKGSSEADRMANRAAEIAQLSDVVIDGFKDHVNMLLSVQNKLATIITHLPNRKRPKHNPVPKPVIASKEQAMAKSEHCLTVAETRYSVPRVRLNVICTQLAFGNLLRVSVTQPKNLPPLM